MIVTAADFRAARERYGLTVQWLADTLRVRQRTVHRWEAGHTPIPDGVADELAAWHAAWLDTVDRFAESIAIDCAETESNAAVLIVPRLDRHSLDDYPAAFHRAAALEAAQACGHDTTVHLDYSDDHVSLGEGTMDA